MKIVIVGPAYPLRGGIAHHTGLLSRALSAHHSVTIITFKRQFPSFLFPGTTQKEAQGELFRVSAEERLDSLNPLTWISVALEIRRRNPELVIFPYSLPFFGPCYGTIAALTRWRKKTRTLFLCHNILPHERHLGDTLLTRWAFTFGDFFVVQSEEVRRDLLLLVPHANVALAYHPVYEMFGATIAKQTARLQLGILQPRVILFFGYVRKYKGLGVLFDALHSLLAGEQLDDIVLLVVGEFYEDESAYRAQAEALGISRAVRFIARYVSQREVSTYFSAADIVVLPYLSATQSGIMQIAYNFDKPVIATRVGGLAEVVADGKTGFIVPPNDPAALADALRQFYVGNREDEFVQNVREEKKKYSWEAMVNAIETLCR
jgi:glycosyltransferase involved in cell wall biosynthesis